MENDPIKLFEQERNERIEKYGQDNYFKKISNEWLTESMRKQYAYNFNWLGRPIIQNPVDIVAMQELVWQIKPDVIVETGIAHGGSLILSASLLALNELCGGASGGQVVAVDIDIREHNRELIKAHPLADRITMIQGSSIDPDVVKQVKALVSGKQRILVCLDSNHTHEHVLAELNAYAPLVTPGSYCVVFDTFVEDVPNDVFSNRPWKQGDNPKTAVWEYLKTHPEFEIDVAMDNKLLMSVAPNGYLKRR